MNNLQEILATRKGRSADSIKRTIDQMAKMLAENPDATVQAFSFAVTFEDKEKLPMLVAFGGDAKDIASIAKMVDVQITDMILTDQREKQARRNILDHILGGHPILGTEDGSMFGAGQALSRAMEGIIVSLTAGDKCQCPECRAAAEDLARAEAANKAANTGSPE